jgi:hypothetical protein
LFYATILDRMPPQVTEYARAVFGKSEGALPMRAIKVFGVMAIALLAAATSEQTNAAVVEYALTFEGTGGNRANGTGILILDEPAALNSFSKSAYGNLVSLTATIGGRTYNFAPSSVEVDLATNQTFRGITGSSSPGVIGPNGLVGTLVLNGFGFWIVNPGGPHLDIGRFAVGPSVIRESQGPKPPLPK